MSCTPTTTHPLKNPRLPSLECGQEGLEMFIGPSPALIIPQAGQERQAVTLYGKPRGEYGEPERSLGEGRTHMPPSHAWWLPMIEMLGSGSKVGKHVEGQRWPQSLAGLSQVALPERSQLAGWPRKPQAGECLAEASHIPAS